MSGEKKNWQLPAPFRGSSRGQDVRQAAEVGHSRSRVSSVYLSDGSSTDFIIVPEFDDPLSKLPVASSSNPSSANGSYGCRRNFEPTGIQYNPYPIGGFGDASNVNTDQDDDFAERLGSAYERIRTMPCATSTKILLSSDPQMLRKQLGVPQHSVLNYPIHSPPDLPNPHTSHHETTFPRSPSARSADMLHSRASEPSAHTPDINTVAHPPHRHRSPDALQRITQRKCMVTASTTENYPPQCNTCSTRTPKPLVSHANPSKLRRYYDDNPFIPPPVPPPRRQASKEALRNSAADTQASFTNANRQSTHLPQIRPPSPFRVDIPHLHTWYDRRTNFNHPPRHSRINQYRETRTLPTSGNTEALASIAWLGTPPMALGYTPDRSCQLASPEFLQDRFNMAIAVEDDNISDEVLVDQLEKVYRTRAVRKEAGLCDTSVSPSSSSAPGKLSKPHNVPQHPPPAYDATSDSADTSIWLAARKALLCIREIIRTEKRYQEALNMLLNAHTATPPPPLMVPYVSALVHASETLLKRFIEDPSAWGVSTAFVTSEDELETTMVSWCAVAGTFFTAENDFRPNGLTGRWRLRKSGATSNSSSSSETKQSSISLSPPLLPMFTTTTPARSQPPIRKLSVRDLAIQPIQRVMRYVLLYRDLLDSTPPASPSRLLVERALEAAARIADHCDRAQRNPAFFYVPK